MARLIVVDVLPPGSWASGVVPALITSALAAVMLVLEPRVVLRRTMLVVLLLAYVAWMLHDDLGWHADSFHLRFAALTAAEGVLVFVFAETRWWRWSALAALPLAAWLVYHLLPAIAADVVSERIAWLVQGLLLLMANGGRRAIQQEDAAAAAS